MVHTAAGETLLSRPINHALFVYQRNCTSSKTRTQKASTEEMRWPNQAHTSGPTNFQFTSHREAIGGGPGAPSRSPVPATPLPRWPCVDCCAVLCVGAAPELHGREELTTVRDHPPGETPRWTGLFSYLCNFTFNFIKHNH